jgi:DNA-binding transcriptional LysR family regulator
MLDWITCVTTFGQVVELGSFSKTAKKLHTSPSAITKRIQWLEDHLNVPLLVRSTRQLSVTEAGQTLYQRSLHLLSEWHEIKQAVSSQHQEVTGTLRVGAPTGFGSHRLLDILPDFLVQYPSVSVDLKLSNCVTQLTDQAIDMYITSALPGKNIDQFHQQKVLQICNKVYASPGYLKQHGTPATLKDLEQHNCIRICYENTNNWVFENETLAISGSLTTNNTIAGLNAAIAGLGLVSVCPYLITEEVNKGLLVPVLTKHHTISKSVYAFYPKQSFVPKKTLAFLNHTINYFTTHPYQCPALTDTTPIQTA